MKKKTIDVQDIKILNILAKHAEVSNKSLSATIGLSEGPTLVRVQNLWEKGFIRSYSAQINLQPFGYNKFYLIRVEVSETSSEAMKERFSSNRFITLLVELQGSTDLLTRIFLGVFQSKSLKAIRGELQLLTTGITGISSITFNTICSLKQKSLHLEEKDVIR